MELILRRLPQTTNSSIFFQSFKSQPHLPLFTLLLSPFRQTLSVTFTTQTSIAMSDQGIPHSSPSIITCSFLFLFWGDSTHVKVLILKMNIYFSVVGSSLVRRSLQRVSKIFFFESLWRSNGGLVVFDH